MISFISDTNFFPASTILQNIVISAYVHLDYLLEVNLILKFLFKGSIYCLLRPYCVAWSLKRAWPIQLD